MSKKIKSIGILIISVAVVAAIVILCFRLYQNYQNWPNRFQSEMDTFFGEGNWECLSEETRKSKMYTVHQYSNTAAYENTRDVPGDYHNWDIRFINRDGEEEIWTITDHAMKINHSKNNLFGSGRYSAKQSFVQQLMNISFAVAEEKMHKEILQSLLAEEEAACLEIDVSCRGGNPPPEMYDALAEQSWFTANKVTVRDYLESGLYDFYIRVHAHDYRVEKLTQEERKHLLDSLENIEEALRQEYGGYADYEIYLDAEHTAEYTAKEE